MNFNESYQILQSVILLKMKNNLAEDLFYHSIDHTIDVGNQAVRIALSENINDEEDLFLLKVACHYHDIGFLITYAGHELEGCKLAKLELPGYGFNEKQIDIICGLIMATKIPQTPLTPMEEVICDADLDYLGRDDFKTISNLLFQEISKRGFVKSEMEWNLIQIKFFNQHRYFTNTSKLLREPEKNKRLEEINDLI